MLNKQIETALDDELFFLFIHTGLSVDAIDMIEDRFHKIKEDLMVHLKTPDVINTAVLERISEKEIDEYIRCLAIRTE
ncbi:MAG TPA: hypothetical protein VG982_01110 [Candidatus Paceibacterota bacterium]|nr:hypothetical protein [Candidatus Paceibacterota bacterium]